MSEKRFNIAYGGNVITDEDGSDFNLSVKWCVEELVGVLNELFDDNRQLKKLLKGNNEKFRKCWDRIYALEKENEQLRQKLDFYLLDEFEWKEKYGDDDE